jgi:hypothetical protein
VVLAAAKTAAVREPPTLRTAKVPDQLIQAPQRIPVLGQQLDDSVPAPKQASKQGAALLGRCLQVRDRRLDFGQRETHFAGGGDELQLRPGALYVVAIAVGPPARRRDEATAFLEPQCVARPAALAHRPSISP